MTARDIDVGYGNVTNSDMANDAANGKTSGQ